MLKKFIRNGIAAVALVLTPLASPAQVVISGSPNVFSNALATASVPIGLNLVTPAHTLTINHGGLLATTNFSCYVRLDLVDAVTGATNHVNVAQVWQAASTNATVETVTLTNFTFACQGSLLLTTTNTMNIPTSPGAAGYVTNTIIFN